MPAPFGRDARCQWCKLYPLRRSAIEDRGAPLEIERVILRQNAEGIMDLESFGCMEGPVGVGQQLAAKRDQIGIAVLENSFRLPTVKDRADGHGCNVGT